MTTTVINVPPGGGQQQQQQPIVIQQPGGQQPIVLPAQVLQQVNNVQQQNSQIPSRYNAQAGLVTGILQGLAAIVTIVCTIFALTYGTEYRFGWGIWAGVLLYGPAGILGIASKGGHRGVIIGYLVLSILSSLSAPMQMIYDSVAASKGGHMGYCHDYMYYDYYYGCIQKDFNHKLQALHAVSAVAMFCEMIIAIVAASYCCCSGICACGTSGGAASSTQTIVVQHQQTPGAPLVTYNQPAVQPQQIPYQPPPYQQQPPYQQPPPQQPPQQQPPYQQLNKEPNSTQTSAYTALNFDQPAGAAPSAPAGPPPAYESSIRAVPTENAENTYMEVIQ